MSTRAKLHDLRKGGWGRSLRFTPGSGADGRVVGHSTPRPANLDMVILEGSLGPIVYQCENIHYYRDPRDMWNADAVHVADMTTEPSSEEMIETWGIAKRGLFGLMY